MTNKALGHSWWTGGMLGVKSISLDQLATAFPELYGTLDEIASTGDSYAAVPWVFRAATIRANAIAGVPWELYQGESDEIADNPFGATDMRWLFWRTQLARDLWGASYWLIRLKEQALYWLNSTTMSYEFDPRIGKGITAFLQKIGGESTRFTPEEIVYMPLWSPTNDLGPGTAPAEVALRSAGLGLNLMRFAEQYFANGAIPAVLLSSEQAIPEAEIERIRTVWEKLFKGIGNAWRTAVLGRGLEPKVIGNPVKDLAMPELEHTVMRNIAAAFEMTVNFLTGENANYATAQMDTVNFYANTVTPLCRLLESSMNTDLWSMLNLRIRFKTESIEAMRQYEATKAQAWANLLKEVNAEYESGLLGRPRAVYLAEQLWSAMSFPIDEIPDEQEEAQPMEAEEAPAPEETAGEGEALPEEADEETEDIREALRSLVPDLRKWRRKALARKGDCAFASEAIPERLAARIHAGLGMAQTRDEIRAVFDAFLEGKAEGFVPKGADQPLEPLPDEVIVTEEDIDRAIAAWDKAMPEFAGLLNAEVINAEYNPDNPVEQ